MVHNPYYKRMFKKSIYEDAEFDYDEVFRPNDQYDVYVLNDYKKYMDLV